MVEVYDAARPARNAVHKYNVPDNLQVQAPNWSGLLEALEVWTKSPRTVNGRYLSSLGALGSAAE